jgi:hypothetical protein
VQSCCCDDALQREGSVRARQDPLVKPSSWGQFGRPGNVATQNSQMTTKSKVGTAVENLHLRMLSTWSWPTVKCWLYCLQWNSHEIRSPCGRKENCCYFVRACIAVQRVPVKSEVQLKRVVVLEWRKEDLEAWVGVVYISQLNLSSHYGCKRGWQRVIEGISEGESSEHNIKVRDAVLWHLIAVMGRWMVAFSP